MIREKIMQKHSQKHPQKPFKQLQQLQSTPSSWLFIIIVVCLVQTCLGVPCLGVACLGVVACLGMACLGKVCLDVACLGFARILATWLGLLIVPQLLTDPLPHLSFAVVGPIFSGLIPSSFLTMFSSFKLLTSAESFLQIGQLFNFSMQTLQITCPLAH